VSLSRLRAFARLGESLDLRLQCRHFTAQFSDFILGCKLGCRF
jgi:hypothetical protein